MTDRLRAVVYSVATLENSTEIAPEGMGCYLVIHGEEVLYAGKAEEGLKKRFQSYYSGNSTGYPSGKKVYQYRDELIVKWFELETKEDCQEFEAGLIDEYDPPWNERSGWGS